jgi:aspartate/methionine/tyrosine aminotransferase
MQIKPFKLERYFAQHEFSVDYLLSASDCESLSQSELLALADPDGRRLWEELELGYTESQGHPLLREAIARLYQTIQPADIIVAAPEEAIFIAMNCILRPGDHLIATFPAYQSLHEIAKAMNCEVTHWELSPETDRWSLDLDFLQDHITDRTRLIVVNFPHNPTGFLPSTEDFESLIQIARRHDLPLFCDEMYWQLEHGNRERLPAACDLYRRAISLFGMSKTFCLPGLRIGWLATRDPALMNRLTTLKDYTTICNSAPSEILALIALRARETIIGRSRGLIHTNLEAARAFFMRYRELFTWLEPDGGSIAFPRYHGSVPLSRFSQELLETRSALLVPGDLFDVPDHFRVGLGRIDFPAGLQQVEAFIRDSGLVQVS